MEGLVYISVCLLLDWRRCINREEDLKQIGVYKNSHNLFLFQND